ncbi:MAG: DDE-type integrase/transposase/recombinase [Candidatus Melainabacteria bacterium]|nr:DDE-type integrase/transposase/recombinase [Candidatus Melainabacteria bacterium]
MYLFRAIDLNVETIDFLLSNKRDLSTAQRFFRRSLGVQQSQQPRVINADENPIYPSTVMELRKTGELK